MSKVKIEGNASGTGTLTISAPNTDTDRTLTLPDGAGEILTSASTLSSSNLSGALPAIDGSALTGISSDASLTPYVSAEITSSMYASDQTATKINIWEEITDSDGAFASDTFTVPSGQAGKYFVASYFQSFDSDNQIYYARIDIYVNGSYEYGVRPWAGISSSARISAPVVTALLDLSVGDYVDIYAFIDTTDGGSPSINAGNLAIFKVG